MVSKNSNVLQIVAMKGRWSLTPVVLNDRLYCRSTSLVLVALICEGYSMYSSFLFVEKNQNKI